MPTRTDLLFAIALSVITAGSEAAERVAPKHLLDDPAALKTFLRDAMGRDVYVMEASLSDAYMRYTTQDAADAGIYDEYRVSPGNPLAEPEPVKVNAVDCKKQRIAWAQFDLVAGRAALQASTAIAAANGFDPPGNVRWGPDVFCKNPGWRNILVSSANGDDFMEITFTATGAPDTARRMLEGRWRKVAIADLTRGAAPALPPPPPKPPALDVVPNRPLALDFSRDPGAAVRLLEAALKKPLPLMSMDVAADRVQFVLLEGRETTSYLVRADGGISEDHRSKLIAFDCDRPFGANTVPIAKLPALVDYAVRTAPPPMDGPRVTSVTITHAGLCGKPQVRIVLEDDRAYANVIFDARGKLVDAAIQRTDRD